MPLPVPIPHNLLNMTSVRLGRLVQDKGDFIDPLISRPADPEVVIHHQDPEATKSVSRVSRFLSYFSKAFSTSHGTQNLQFKTYNLNNPEAWFEDACALDETRRWLLDAFNDTMNVHLIVGIRTFQDARSSGNATLLKNREVGAEMSVSHLAILPGVISATPAANLAVELPVAGSRESSALHASSEQIVAIRYRKVKLSYFPSEEAFVGTKTKWKIYDVGGAYGGNAEEKDAVEAYLVDASDTEGFGGEHLGDDGVDPLQEGEDSKGHIEQARRILKRERRQERVGRASNRLITILCLCQLLVIILWRYSWWLSEYLSG